MQPTKLLAESLTRRLLCPSRPLSSPKGGEERERDTTAPIYVIHAAKWLIVRVRSPLLLLCALLFNTCYARGGTPLAVACVCVRDVSPAAMSRVCMRGAFAESGYGERRRLRMDTVCFNWGLIWLGLWGRCMAWSRVDCSRRNFIANSVEIIAWKFTLFRENLFYTNVVARYILNRSAKCSCRNYCVELVKKPPMYSSFFTNSTLES